MIKTFVLDTNVLLHNADAIECFEENNILLPMAVIEELDGFKKFNDELGRNARHVVRRLDELRSKGNLRDGVPLPGGGMLRIVSDGAEVDKVGLRADIPDNRMLRVAYALNAKGENVVFVSKDINARLKADALGIQAQDFENQKVNIDELYTGYQEVNVPRATLDRFHDEDKLDVTGFGEFPNQFILMRDEADNASVAIARVTKPGTLTHLNTQYDHVWNIEARNQEQRLALELLMDPQVQMVTLVGQAGTGKTLLALAAALQSTLKNHRYDRILVARPIMPMGRDIGYLPGTKDEKLAHWMQPVFDNLAYLMKESRGESRSEDSGGKKAHVSPHDKTERLMKDKTIEIEALTYIRGRSIPGQYVIIDEAQNLTPHEVKTIVSRAGEGTKMVLTGDPYQIDNPYLDASSNGLTYASERMKTQAIHGHITLRKSERSMLAAIAAENL
jgi:PhoH-like ATPase